MSFQKDGISLNAPVGTIVAYTNNATIPNGWLSCDGATISNSDYPALFAFLGETGQTLNLPNLNGHFLRGTGSATFNNISYAGENNVKNVQEDSIREHTHNIVYAVLSKDGSGSATLNGFLDIDDGKFTDLTGGLETRPINYTIVWIIKT